MDGSTMPPSSVSAMAGRITRFLAGRHHAAERMGDPVLAARYDLGLDVIYSASLLLMVDERTGIERGREELLDMLAIAAEIIRDLHHWAEAENV